MKQPWERPLAEIFPDNKLGGKRQRELFIVVVKPRTWTRRMHVIDAGGDFGNLWLHFSCQHCGHDEEGFYPGLTVHKSKRGLPCPKCNSNPNQGA